MIPIIDINLPLRILRNTTQSGQSSAKEVLDLSWDSKELQEFFFLYVQNTEAANLKASNIFQAKVDSQLAAHCELHPDITDLVDPDEDLGTDLLNATRDATKVSSETTETKPTKKAKVSKKSEKTKKKAFKKSVLLSLDETVPAFDSSLVENSVAAAESTELVLKPTTVVEELNVAEEVHDIVAKSDEAVDFEIGLTESRVPAAISTIQIARPSIFATVQKLKSTFVGPLPLPALPALPSLEKLQLNSAFWYNLSMAQKIERPLGFELIHTGLSANASIDRSSNKFNAQSSYLYSLIAKALKEYNSVLKSIEVLPSAVDTKFIEPPSTEVQSITPPKVIVEARLSSKTKKQEGKLSRSALVKPGATKKARRQRRKRSRSKKAKKAKKVTRAAALRRTTKVKVPITVEDLDEVPEAKKTELLERIPEFDVSLPELSDEADSDRDIIEVDELPVYLDADEIEDKKGNTLQVGQLSMYYHFMNLLRLAELQVPTSVPSLPEQANNLQVGQLSMYHTFMKLLRHSEKMNAIKIRNAVLGEVRKITNTQVFTAVADHAKVDDIEVNNLQVGQLSPYHYFMKLLKLSEDYHRQKYLSEMRRAIQYYHSLGPSIVIIACVPVELPPRVLCVSVPVIKKPSSMKRKEDCRKKDEPVNNSQTNQKSVEVENTSNEDVEMNDNTGLTPMLSSKCKPTKRRFSKKPSFPKNAKKPAAGPNTSHISLTSNAKHRRQRAKKAQRNREFFITAVEKPDQE